MSQAKVQQLKSAINALKGAILQNKTSDPTKVAQIQESMTTAIEQLIRFQTEAATKQAIKGAQAVVNASSHGGR